ADFDSSVNPPEAKKPPLKVFGVEPLNHRPPSPCFVKAPVPLTTPLRTRASGSPAVSLPSTWQLPLSVTGPDQEFEPTYASVTIELAFGVKASRGTVATSRWSWAFDETTVRELVVPSNCVAPTSFRPPSFTQVVPP